jgi:TonB family protein
MSNRQVWQAMGKRGEEEGRTRDSSGYRSIERYEKTSAPLLVHYDGTVGKKSSARVISIETTFEENVVDIPDLMGTLRTRLGEPSSGAANLDNGLKGGPVEWTNPECDVQVTLFRRAASWWEPAGSAEFHVKIDALSFAQTGELGSEPPQAVASTPPVPVVEPSAENAALPSPATNGRTTIPGDSVEPASSDDSPMIETSVIYMAGVDGVSHPTRRAGKTPAPRLPAAARSRVTDGQIILEVVVRKDGTVGDIVVLQVDPTGVGLEQAATRAVKKWRYDPAELDGEPVDARVNVSFRFK